MSYKVISERELAGVHLEPGDHLRVSYTGKDKKTTELRHAIKRRVVVERLAILEIRNELGFKHGLIGAFGS